MINEYNAYSLSDFMRIVSDIGRKMGTTPEKPPVLWFRGQRVYTWDLKPSIFRKVNDREKNLEKEENARKEHFVAMVIRQEQTALIWWSWMRKKRKCPLFP